MSAEMFRQYLKVEHPFFTEKAIDTLLSIVPEQDDDGSIKDALLENKKNIEDKIDLVVTSQSASEKLRNSLVYVRLESKILAEVINDIGRLSDLSMSLMTAGKLCDRELAEGNIFILNSLAIEKTIKMIRSSDKSPAAKVLGKDLEK